MKCIRIHVTTSVALLGVSFIHSGAIRLEELIKDVSSEYMARIDVEKKKAEMALLALKEQQRLVTESIREYQDEMELELQDVV